MVVTTLMFASVSRDTDKTDAALVQLQKATSNENSLINLAALRNLRDIDLRPFFFQFAQHPDWPVQVHAVLGLAELSDEQTIDPWLVQQVAPLAREHLLLQAIDDGLVQKEQMESLLKWPLLENTPKLWLISELSMLGEVPDKTMLRELSSTTELSVAMFAALLLGEDEVIDEVTRRLRRASSIEKDKALQTTFQMIRQYKLQSAATWLHDIIENKAIALNDNERYFALHTLLEVAPDEGIALWENQFPTEPNRKEQVRYLLVLLESNIIPTAKMIERLDIDLDDSLLGLMAKSGAVNKPNDRVTISDVDALASLIKRGHRDSTEWSFEAAENLSEANQVLLYTELSKFEDDASLRRRDSASRAFSRLINIKPEKAWKLLHDTKDDSTQQEYMLLAMLQITDDIIIKDAIEQASMLKRIGVNKADVMTLLLMARGQEPLPDIDQKYLGIIAAGGGDVIGPLKTQAAWLYLKKMGLADKALAAVSTQ